MPVNPVIQATRPAGSGGGGGGTGTVTNVSSPDTSLHITTATTTPKLEVRLGKKGVTESSTAATADVLVYTSTASKWVLTPEKVNLHASTHVLIKISTTTYITVAGSIVIKNTVGTVTIKGTSGLTFTVGDLAHVTLNSGEYLKFKAQTHTVYLYVFNGNPNTHVDAAAKGAICYDTSTPALWQSSGSGTTDWVKLGGSGTVTTVSSPTGEISVSTPTTTPKLEIAKTPSGSLVAGVGMTITTTSKKAKLHPLDNGYGGSFRSDYWYGLFINSGSAFTKGKIYFIPFNIVWTTFHAIAIACYVSTAKASSKVRLGIYADNGHGKPGAKILDAGQVSTTTTGAKSITITHVLPPAPYWLCSVSQTTGTAPSIYHGPTVASVQASLVGISQSTTAFTESTSAQMPMGWITTGTTHTGTLPTTAPAIASAGITDIPAVMLKSD